MADCRAAILSSPPRNRRLTESGKPDHRAEPTRIQTRLLTAASILFFDSIDFVSARFFACELPLERFWRKRITRPPGLTNQSGRSILACGQTPFSCSGALRRVPRRCGPANVQSNRSLGCTPSGVATRIKFRNDGFSRAVSMPARRWISASSAKRSWDQPFWRRNCGSWMWARRSCWSDGFASSRKGSEVLAKCDLLQAEPRRRVVAEE